MNTEIVKSPEMNDRKYINGHRIDLIVFDWDGTLMDSAATIARCIQATAQDLGVRIPTEEQARYVIGLGLVEALRFTMPELSEDQYLVAVERYRYHFLLHGKDTVLFPGVMNLIAQLTDREYSLAVATGKSRNGLDRALVESGLLNYFGATRCVDECHSKPHPQMLTELIDEFGATPESTLMIGDTTHDMLMGKNARTHTLAVSYGAHPRDVLESESPTHCVSSVEDLVGWLIHDAR